MTRVLLACLALLVACGGESRSNAPLLNRCVTSAECDRGTGCELDLGICSQLDASVPYPYRVQITPTEVTDAGQLATSTTPLATFTGAQELPVIQLANAVFVRGSVLGLNGLALEAELIFQPRIVDPLVPAISVFTRPSASGQRFRAQLEPNRLYDVLVYPVGPDSRRYPPYSFELPMGAGDLEQSFPYPELVALRGEVRDEAGVATPGLRIKTRYRDRQLASSSLGTLDEEGRFEIWLPDAVRTAPAEHVLALDLSGVLAPQNVQVVFDMTKAPTDNRWVMPEVPARVEYSGAVEILGLQDRPSNISAVNAQLTFITSFPPLPDENDQRDVDWCRLKRAGAPTETFTCSANVTTSVGPDLEFRVDLLPGDYQIVIAPAAAAADLQRQRLATALSSERILSQPDGKQMGGLLQLTRAPLFESRVRNPDDLPMPSVVVTSNALGVRSDLPQVALYNRSDRQSTEWEGNALLATDVGIYDLLAAPPERSGYAWVLAYNRRISEDARLLEPVRLRPGYPLLLRGSARTTGNEAVPNANVDAYALVPNVEGGPDRAVRIAHTTTDREGKFALQMPPRLGRPEDDVVDGGLPDGGEDAGGDAQR